VPDEHAQTRLSCELARLGTPRGATRPQPARLQEQRAAAEPVQVAAAVYSVAPPSTLYAAAATDPDRQRRGSARAAAAGSTETRPPYNSASQRGHKARTAVGHGLDRQLPLCSEAARTQRDKKTTLANATHQEDLPSHFFVLCSTGPLTAAREVSRYNLSLTSKARLSERKRKYYRPDPARARDRATDPPPPTSNEYCSCKARTVTLFTVRGDTSRGGCRRN
jgi:hypothetical protein